MEKEMFEKLKADVIRRGLPNWYYEPIEEPLTDRFAWETLPPYYQTQVAENNERVCKLLRENPEQEAFVFFSDAHVRQNRMSSVPILRSILEHTPVRDVFYGGDTVSAWVTDQTMREDMRYFEDAFAFANPYMVRGNHDVAGKNFAYSDVGSIAPEEEVRQWILCGSHPDARTVPGKNYYYFDRPAKRLRYIVIDTTDVMERITAEDGSWLSRDAASAEELRWFGALLAATPKEYRIVVLGHVPVVRELKWFTPTALPFGEVIGAFNRRESVAVSADGGTATFDFSGAQGKVILVLCGHGHCDDVYVSPEGCIYYEINCDAWIDNGGSAYRRTPGTVTENALDVLLLNLCDGSVQTIRYGAGESRRIGKEK